MTVVIDPLLLGNHAGDNEPVRNDTARTGGAKINANLENLATAVNAAVTDSLQKDGSVPVDLFLDFTPGAAPAHSEGRMYYDSTKKGITFFIDSSAVAANLPYELWLRARNTTGSTIEDGSVVFISDSTGEIAEVTKAIATADTPRIIGVATEDIAHNSTGTVTTFGDVGGINTVGFNAGDMIYLSDSVAGAFTATRPDLPNETIEIGVIIKVAGSGKIFVSPAHITSQVTLPIIGAASDETTDLTTGAAKMTYRMPFAFTVTEVRASLTTAPVGSTLVADINETGTSILSTKISIDVTEKTSTTAATPPVISDAALADDAEITIDIDQIGSGTAGAGIKVYLIGYQS